MSAKTLFSFVNNRTYDSTLSFYSWLEKGAILVSSEKDVSSNLALPAEASVETLWVSFASSYVSILFSHLTYAIIGAV